MVRPNYDIPNRLHGAVKDYAESEGIDDDEAFRQLLLIALRDVGVLPYDGRDQRGENNGNTG